jgi:spore maturation protein CgeB
MKLVIFGLSISSSWGNGHATLWRGLCGALARRGNHVVFFERDVSYYADHRDLWEIPGGKLILYRDWSEVLPTARHHLADADVGMVTSYCPDALVASDLVLDSRAPVHSFYDLDSPVTLDRLESGEFVDYIGPRGLADFDVVLSYAGGRALGELKRKLGARFVAPLYGSVDPAVHRPVAADERYRADLSYLGTHAPDRDAALRAFLVEPARRFPERRFLIAGSKYDGSFPWEPNIFFLNHVPCADHPALYCSAKLNLNVTRGAMMRNGYCPSGRLFEAAACGAAILSDSWEGMELFFEPGREILMAHSTDDALAALERSPEELAAIGQASRERTLANHTADIRALELENILASACHAGRESEAIDAEVA